MGAGIAQVAASAGHPVKLLDNRPGAAAQAVQGIAAQLNRLAEKGKLTAQAAQDTSARLSAAAQLSDLADCGLVIEAIVEDLQAKRKLFWILRPSSQKIAFLQATPHRFRSLRLAPYSLSPAVSQGCTFSILPR